MLFLVSAFVGGILVAFEAKPEELIGSATFHFARAAVHAAINIYLVKDGERVHDHGVDGVPLHRHHAALAGDRGYALALLVLFGSYYVSWSFYVFPLWVGLVSIVIIIDDVRPRPAPSGPSA